MVDQSQSFYSREFVRRVDATPDVQIVRSCISMDEAQTMLNKKEAYGILLFPPEFSKNLHSGRQATVSLYCDMSLLLYYKAMLLSTTEVSLEMGGEIHAQNRPQSTEQLKKIEIEPIPYESTTLFNPANGFASFLLPAVLILIIQIGIERLQIVRDSTDGFVIAQKDLQLRGAGELLGKRQTGDMGYYMSDVIRDEHLLDLAKDLAWQLMQDPDKHPLCQAMMALWLPASGEFVKA